MTRKSDSAVQAQADFSTHVLSTSNDDADEYGQSFNLTQLRQDVSGLQAEVRSLRNRNININIYIYCQQYVLLDKLAVACILIIKETNAFDKDQWSVAKLIDVKDSPPYFLLVLGCIVGSALELFLLGPPAMQRAQSWCLAKRAKQTYYRFYLLLAFFYGAYTDISATIAFCAGRLAQFRQIDCEHCHGYF